MDKRIDVLLMDALADMQKVNDHPMPTIITSIENLPALVGLYYGPDSPEVARAEAVKAEWLRERMRQVRKVSDGP